MPGFGQKHQQNVHEFDTHVVSAMSDMLIEKKKEFCMEICNSCQKITTGETSDIQSLVFSVIPEVYSISIQTRLAI